MYFLGENEIKKKILYTNFLKGASGRRRAGRKKFKLFMLGKIASNN